MASNLAQAPATTVRDTFHAQLGAEATALLEWLVEVCERSDRGYDQMFIFRTLSFITRFIRRDTRAEIKAIGMSDLLKVREDHFHLLRRTGLVTVRRGRWPGKWFVVNVDAVVSEGER